VRTRTRTRLCSGGRSSERKCELMEACTLGSPTSATAPSGGVFSSPGKRSMREGKRRKRVLAALLSYTALTGSWASPQRSRCARLLPRDDSP